ncbi:hypothetical protein Fmac_000881 [Flemingia macrophylla]|uniref:Pentatricopeptide repeat-containing protein n=1 Tax=Flemingia macrophylla TaxID=520843 RepID=A0ABD1NFN1_9FABA
MELKKIHAHIVKLSLSHSNFMVTNMLDLCDNNVNYATLLFQQLLQPNVFSYNAIIKTTPCDDLTGADNLFEEMTERDAISWNSLILGHARLGQIKSARKVFDEMYCRTIVSWTTMINGYVRVGCYVDALEILCEMQVAVIESDEISVISVLPACAQIWSLEVGKWIHNSQVLGDKRVLEENHSCKTHCNLEIVVVAMEQLLELEPEESEN